MPLRGRQKLYLLSALLLLAAILSLRYTMLAREASSSLSNQFLNGICLENTTTLCSFYLEAPGDTLETIIVELNSSRAVFHLPMEGLTFEKLVEGRITIGRGGEAVLSLVADGRTRVESKASLTSTEPAPRQETGSRILGIQQQLEFSLAPHTGHAVEMRLEPSTNNSYAIVVRGVRGHCMLDVKLYAFQDRLAWEAVGEMGEGENIVVPVGGLLDERGVGPLYTKLIINNLGGATCRVRVEILNTPPVHLKLILVDAGEATASLPLLNLNLQGGVVDGLR